MTNIERDVGALEARMETVEHEIHAMRRDVREIRDALVTARGGWRTLTASPFPSGRCSHACFRPCCPRSSRRTHRCM